MSVSVALTFATTVLSYFSPTKSPYYSVIVFGTIALILSATIKENWNIIFIPIAILLLFATALSLKNKPDFKPKEYDDQIKFSRAFGLSTAVLCLVFVGRKISPGENGNQWFFWLAYLSSLSQIVIFAFYTYVYTNLEAKPLNRNFIQLALITSTFLIGSIYSTIQYSKQGAEGIEHYSYIMAVFYLLWLLTIVVWVSHLRKTISFKFLIPEDAKLVSADNSDLESQIKEIPNNG